MESLHRFRGFREVHAKDCHRRCRRAGSQGCLHVAGPKRVQRNQLRRYRAVTETLFQSATDAADMVRRKETSSLALTEMLLARIDAVNPALNAVVELRREVALQ